MLKRNDRMSMKRHNSTFGGGNGGKASTRRIRTGAFNL